MWYREEGCVGIIAVEDVQGDVRALVQTMNGCASASLDGE